MSLTVIILFPYRVCDESLYDKLVNDGLHLDYDENFYDWFCQYLDCMDIISIQKLKAIYDKLTSLGVDLQENMSRDFYKRNLDWFLINA